jgi:CheY-like chemotaxis protein
MVNKVVSIASPMPLALKAGIKIMIVEDNHINMEVLTIKLQKQGFTQLIRATNGLEALAMLAEHPDTKLILMDIQMPVMDGYEATRAIRDIESKTGGRLPIIAVTANVTQNDRNLAWLSGMDDFLTKPVNTEQLCQRIESILFKP